MTIWWLILHWWSILHQTRAKHLHTTKHLHAGTFVFNHVRLWPVYVSEWNVSEVSLQGKKTKAFHLEVRLPVLSTPKRSQDWYSTVSRSRCPWLATVQMLKQLTIKTRFDLLNHWLKLDSTWREGLFSFVHVSCSSSHSHSNQRNEPR